MAKNTNANETNDTPAVDTPAVDTVSVTIANTDVALPVRFTEGHTLSEAEAKVLDAAYRRQFRNNKDAAFKAWEAKVAKEGSDKAGANPCDAASLISDYTTYTPNVGGEGVSSLEKARNEAGLLTLKDMIAASNEAFDATGKGTFFAQRLALPTGKGSADIRESWVQRVLQSKNDTVVSMVQAHLDTILAAKKADKATNVPQATKLSETVEANF